MDTDKKPHESNSQESVGFGNYDPKLDLSNYKYPHLELLEIYKDSNKIDHETLESNKNKIVATFNYSQIEIDAIRAVIGPSLTIYEFIPAPGVRVSKIKSLKDDLALNLVAEINIIGPIPGKGTMAIEVPHATPAFVSIRSVLATEKFQQCTFDLPIALGRTMTNEVYLSDLTKLPHLLIAGATGQGKSVCLNAILFSLLYKKHPSQLKFVLIDTSNLELGLFRKIENHFLAKLPNETEAVISDQSKASDVLNGLLIELDQRYELLKNAGVRQIKEYNQKFIDRKLNPGAGHRFLPYIVVVIDEFAELLTENKEIELLISRLAQLGRAAGIHLIISTQRPSVKVITGTIKANFTARLAFRVTSAIDSRTILDSSGAELLNGSGDMLLSTGSEIIHLQGSFVDTAEVERVSEFIGNQRGYPSTFNLPQYGITTVSTIDFDPDERDSMFEDAARLIVMHQQGSTSLIQRKLKLGYNRAGRIIDQLEAAGIIGPFDGSKAREVKLPDYALEVFLNRMNSGNASNVIPKVVIPIPVKIEPIKTEPVNSEMKIMDVKPTQQVKTINVPSSEKSKPDKKTFWDWFFK
jgi:S-DNA-T family DNA segregation ATPase FtsK/SpoIIIE